MIGDLLTGSNFQGFICAALLQGWTVVTLQSPVCSSFLWSYCVQKEVRWKMREGQEGTMEMEKGLRVVGTPAPPLCAHYHRYAGVSELGIDLWWVKPPVLGCFTGSVNLPVPALQQTKYARKTLGTNYLCHKPWPPEQPVLRLYPAALASQSGLWPMCA